MLVILLVREHCIYYSGATAIIESDIIYPFYTLDNPLFEANRKQLQLLLDSAIYFKFISTYIKEITYQYSYSAISKIALT